MKWLRLALVDVFWKTPLCYIDIDAISDAAEQFCLEDLGIPPFEETVGADEDVVSHQVSGRYIGSINNQYSWSMSLVFLSHCSLHTCRIATRAYLVEMGVNFLKPLDDASGSAY